MDPGEECAEQTSYPVNLVELSVEEAKASIDNTSDPTAVCSGGRNGLFYVVQRAKEDESLELLEYILDNVPGLDVDIRDDFGQTPLYYAAREGYISCLEVLVKRCKLDVSQVDNACQTPLFYAARDGRSETVVWLVEQAGADINHVDGNGETPLFYAARDGREQTVTRMIELGADPTVRNKKKAYASAIARKNGHKQLAVELDQLRKQRESGGSSVGRKTAADTKRRATRKSTPPPPMTRAASRRKRVLEETQNDTEVPSAKRRSRRAPPPPEEEELAEGEILATEEEITRVPAETAPSVATTATSTPPQSPTSAAPSVPQSEDDAESKNASPTQPSGVSSKVSDDAATKSHKDGVERQVYQLQFLAPGEAWSFAPVAKLEEFEALFPAIAVWNKSGSLPVVGLELDPHRNKWHELAVDLLKYLGSLKGAWLFNEPVDPIKWKINDYFDIVKKPMDFYTIRQRLNQGTHYRTVKEFIDDLELVFHNCILYNSGESEVGQVCVRIRNQYLNHARRSGLLDMLEAEERRWVISKKIAASALARRSPVSSVVSSPKNAPSPREPDTTAPCSDVDDTPPVTQTETSGVTNDKESGVVEFELSGATHPEVSGDTEPYEVGEICEAEPEENIGTVDFDFELRPSINLTEDREATMCVETAEVDVVNTTSEIDVSIETACQTIMDTADIDTTAVTMEDRAVELTLDTPVLSGVSDAIKNVETSTDCFEDSVVDTGTHVVNTQAIETQDLDTPDNMSNVSLVFETPADSLTFNTPSDTQDNDSAPHE